MTKININMDFIDVVKDDVKKYMHNISSNLAHRISDELAQEYQYVIDRFYNEYEPLYYIRHSTKGMQSGLSKTFKKYYKNPHNTIYYGGIEITSKNMYDDYHDSKEDVLNSFLNGYHGRPSLGIESFLAPFEHMLRFRNLLATKINIFVPDAVNKAKKTSYKLLRW